MSYYQDTRLMACDQLTQLAEMITVGHAHQLVPHHTVLFVRAGCLCWKRMCGAVPNGLLGKQITQSFSKPPSL